MFNNLSFTKFFEICNKVLNIWHLNIKGMIERSANTIMFVECFYLAVLSEGECLTSRAKQSLASRYCLNLPL